MAFTPDTWLDRQSQFPNRRRLTAVSGQQDVYDISREEGTISVTGSPLNATALNALEQKIYDMNNTLFGSEVGTAQNPIVLLASDWNSSTHLITVSVTGVTTLSHQDILPMPATSQANIENNLALQAANIMDAGQTSGQITLYAKNVPSVDLNIRVIVRT